MKILLVGYGKMGKTIERIASSRGHEIAGRIDIGNPEELDSATADVAIEFSHPDAAYGNIKKCLQRQIPVVCGTTGWLRHKPEIEEITRSSGGSFFYASNYSLGVNIFFHLNERLAAIMKNFEQYEIRMEETHHTEKKDAPSGTAITLAEGILKNIPRKKSWVNNTPPSEKEIGIQSYRVDEVPGTHVVTYTSAIDDIQISHTAHSREGFALGAVMVAEWIRDKKGVLTMEDFLRF